MQITELIKEIELKHAEFDRLFPRYAEVLGEYENLKEARDALKESKKDVLNKHLTIEDQPEWKANKLARDDPEYVTLLEDIKKIDDAIMVARTRWRKAWGIVEPIKLRIESLRTEISALKTEVRSFGG